MVIVQAILVIWEVVRYSDATRLSAHWKYTLHAHIGLIRHNRKYYFDGTLHLGSKPTRIISCSFPFLRVCLYHFRLRSHQTIRVFECCENKMRRSQVSPSTQQNRSLSWLDSFALQDNLFMSSDLATSVWRFSDGVKILQFIFPSALLLLV